ncbi:molecular chaperone [Sphingomonas sp. ASV193]|uniref:fimbrial biogenesis chaperone n=1 Tax=Sphingomonas sp. ASV193 TaxID=3144405 RepID=UPI0032E8DB15
MGKSVLTAIGLAAAGMLVAAPASAGIGDLLVAPTRLVLNGGRGTEVILKNIGTDTATYRISAELRRMMPDGSLVEVKDPNADEKAAQDMVLFAPRKVTLPPNQPQSIRVSAHAPVGLPDGEYRVHLLFRALPPPTPAEAPGDAKGIAFKLIPIYGVTIPVIVRFGNLEAKSGIAAVEHETVRGREAISLELTRQGGRSTFGEVRVIRAGVKEPIAEVKGVAVYKELTQRRVVIPVDSAYKGPIAGPVTVQYLETGDNGANLVAETSAVLR